MCKWFDDLINKFVKCEVCVDSIFAFKTNSYNKKISHKNVRCCQFCCQMYTDVVFQFEFVEIENKKSIYDVNYGIYF